MAITGPLLRSERRTAEITATEIAARMRLSRQSLYVLERSAVVTVARAQAYRDALRDAIEASRERTG